MTGPDYMAGIAARFGAMATSLLFALIAARCSVGVAIALYAVGHPTHPTLELGSVAFRTIEAVFYIAGVVSWMTVLSIATSTPSEAQPASQPISDALASAHDRAGVAAVSAFVVGGPADLRHRPQGDQRGSAPSSAHARTLPRCSIYTHWTNPG